MKQSPIKLPIPRWAAILYAVFSAVLIPWTIYLAWALPRRHLVRHWDISWSGLDIGIIVVLLLTAYLAFRKSAWVAISATAVGTLLIADAWFDILDARVGTELVASILLAIFVELPVAFMSFWLAYHTLNKNID